MDDGFRRHETPQISSLKSDPKNIPPRRGYSYLPARDPYDFQTWDLAISDRQMKYFASHANRRNPNEPNGRIKELVYVVKPLLLNPRAVFRGIRDPENDISDGDWLCYCGKPSSAFDYKTGEQRKPWENQVVSVYVNDSREIYLWHWPECDPYDDFLPIDHESRFTERLL